MAGEGDIVERLKELNIVPLSLSYEYDPCDFLKAKEMQQKRDIEGFKKSQQDDLNNMKTGIFGYKGQVHFQAAPCINDEIDALRDLPKAEIFSRVAKLIDNHIFCNYRLYTGNYVAFDLLNNTKRFEHEYTPDDKARFETYVNKKIDLIDLPGKDRDFLRNRILTMYAYPVINKINATTT